MKFYALIYDDITETVSAGSHDVSDTVSFSTKVHGGYSSCSFDIYGSASERIAMFNTYLGKSVVVVDMFGFRCFEGRITNLSNQKGLLATECSGYYEDGANVFDDLIYLADPEKTNYINNPSFENNVTDSWTHNGEGTVAQDSSQAFYGYDSLKATQPSSSGDELEFYTTINTTGTSFTFSLYAKNGNIETTPQIYIIQKDGTGGGGSELKSSSKSLSAMSDSQWIRYSVYIEQSETGIQSVILKLTVKGDSKQGYFYVDAVQFEGEDISSYLDGDLGDGYDWTGTAHNSPSTRENMYPYARDIIQDACDLVPSWGKPVYSGNFDSRIDVDMDFSQVKVSDAVVDTLKFGFSNTYFLPAYLVIYTTRVPQIVVEQTSVNPDWYLDVKLLTNDSIGMEVSLNDVFNRVFAVYDNANDGISVTEPANNYASQARYGVREGLIDNGDTPGGLALAEDLRDTALEKYKNPRRVVSITLGGYVRNGSGSRDYVYKIRAGQNAVLSDLDLFSSQANYLSSESSVPLNGFIFSTDYDVKNNTIKIDIGTDDLSFEVLMSRLGLSGGLK